MCTVCQTAVSALSIKDMHPVKNCAVYLSAMRCKWQAYGSADAIVRLSSLASLKPRMVYLSHNWLTWKVGC